MPTMKRNFYERDPEAAAAALLGCHLVRELPEGRIRVRITETEAYKGTDDPASHAGRGRTPRSAVMFGRPGIVYVYLIYGLHCCVNLVAHEGGEGAAGAVLLRAGEVLEGLALVRANRPGVKDSLLVNGPGKLAAALRIDRSLNGYDAAADPLGLFRVEAGESGLLTHVRTPRIGISAARELPWRFVADGSGKAT